MLFVERPRYNQVALVGFSTQTDMANELERMGAGQWYAYV